MSKAATPGTVTLSVASDGGLTLTVQNTQTDRRSAIKTELPSSCPTTLTHRSTRCLRTW